MSPSVIQGPRRVQCATARKNLTRQPRGIVQESHFQGPGIIMSLPLGPGRNEFGPVVRVRTAKSAVASDHFLHAHFPGWQGAIVMKCATARIRPRAPRHLSGLADVKVG